ncbi:2OG-Fe(II) oxygenase [Vibrio parahaemolyticus]|uniref:2OG-Fe(II) oxygenase family protein n=1 Tax=Vibrio parahaemolyticus TaxID=670 RepID=UPI0012FE0B62|nr:2OG-Fe(II) oxygenase [Vibrio parahaemolyticus]EHK0751970.1 2OG-Fe(II) oxygenase [Vibrio parahaemolyticus]EJB8572663.1 2OG-Fe(II) oxygenase [Vibrio parahaemolyticus]EJE4178987.1 2OG-Fe(II) oxygenase [Vibrio parahaemolyticus]ELB2951172.1 2OG-Fe(II) oxygenase [Vibrio parahaemolyticus]MCR9783813.1 2OG-Fe(II) oxygenase [Vibrio parahaemolyticus]
MASTVSEGFFMGSKSRDISLNERKIANGVIAFQILNQKECVELIEQLEEVNLWEQADIAKYKDKKLLNYYVDLEEKNVQLMGSPHVPSLCEKISKLSDSVARNVFERNWETPNARIHRVIFCKYSVGSHIKLHNDIGTRSFYRLASLVIYLNDSFDGGNITFPDVGLSYKPQAGEAVIFPSEYMHLVEPVTSGIRYSIVTFFVVERLFDWLKVDEA